MSKPKLISGLLVLALIIPIVYVLTTKPDVYRDIEDEYDGMFV